jgi:magnesium transporter
VIKPLEKDALVAFIARKDLDSVRAALKPCHPFDIASVLPELPPGQQVEILLALPAKRQAQVFGYLDAEEQLALARALRREDLGRLFADMDPDERADLFKRLPEAVREAIVPGLAQAEREDIRKLAAYPENTVGAVMTSAYAAVPPDVTAREAIDLLRQEAPNRETIYEVFVIDATRDLLGVVSLRDLLLAAPESRVSEVMRREVVKVAAEAPRAEAARLIGEYDLIALPVTNGGGKLVGIVTADDAMEVAEQEVTEDFQKQAALDFGKKGAIGPVTVNVLEAPLWLLYRARIPWLVILVFGNIFSGAGIATFEEMIEANVALVFFLPLLIDSGGNAGSQAATLMVRALALGDVRMRDYAKLIAREVVIAGMLGFTMALAVSLIGIVRGGPEVAAVVSLSMVIIVVVGSTIGMSLRFLLSRFGRDPATASAPLITSIADGLGVLIYFGLAYYVFGFVGAENG